MIATEMSFDIRENLHWAVQLSNGLTVYQDDGKSSPYSAWLRLQEYLKQEPVDIVDMYVQFRSNKIILPSNKQGYYFSNGIMGFLNSTTNIVYYVVGYLQDDKVYVTQYKTPELIILDTDIRERNKVGKALIVNEGKISI